MYVRVYVFISVHKILFKNRYGFREKQTTYIVFLHLIDQLSNELDRKYYSLGIFTDISKAFDIHDQKILINNCITMVSQE